MSKKRHKTDIDGWSTTVAWYSRTVDYGQVSFYIKAFPPGSGPYGKASAWTGFGVCYRKGDDRDGEVFRVAHQGGFISIHEFGEWALGALVEKFHKDHAFRAVA
jgi:hypothetical protein